MIIVHRRAMRLCLGTVVLILVQLVHRGTASLRDAMSNMYHPSAGAAGIRPGTPDHGDGGGPGLDNVEGMAVLHRAARRAPDRPESESPPVPGNNNDVPIRHRDPYIFNLFEVLLTTLETKLRRVENMDKALERLVHRLDTMEERLAINYNLTNQMMRMMESQVVDAASINEPPSSRRGRHFGSTTEDAYSIHARITELSNHVTRIDSKINNIQVSLESNALPQDELVAEASENYRVNIPRVQVLDKNPSISALQHTLDGVYESCSTIDRRLQYHMDIVSDNLEVLSHNVRDIHLAVIDTPSTGISASEDAIYNNGTMEEPRNKIDLLVSRMDPFVTVWQKMEEVWGVVVGTKTSVDHLVPKSDALLSTSERQERAISVIQSDLNAKTNKIIKNLGQMEERLKTIPPNGKADRDHINPISLIRLTHVEEDKPNEQAPPFDLLDQTFLTEISNSDPSVTTTERSEQRTQVGPSGLVFPSVQKKPVVINSTFVISGDDSQFKQGYSCSDLMLQGMKESDTYYIKIRGTTYWFLKVYCDMQIAGGGWTVIQRRDDYGEPRENFIRDWNAYKHGFGSSNEEFWLGNENIYMLTNTEDYILRIELEDFDGNKRYAEYSTFKLHGESEMYKLEIGGYSGNAGDSLNDPWYGSNLSPFSTYNSDNDRSSLNCASMLKGGWWWRSCGRGLNGLYLTDPNDLTARQGIVWFRWRGWDYSLKKSVMMIRPKDYNKDRYTSTAL